MTESRLLGFWFRGKGRTGGVALSVPGNGGGRLARAGNLPEYFTRACAPARCSNFLVLKQIAVASDSICSGFAVSVVPGRCGNYGGAM